MFLSAVYYYFPKYGGKCWFKGPISTIKQDPVDESSLEKEND
jgi:hypothetical protein